MAKYFAATTWEKALETCKISRTEETDDGITIYVIVVNVPPYSWHVVRRYRDFRDLHEKLVKKYLIDKNLLPPKKIFGNRSETFVAKRQAELELYLQTLVHQFAQLPEPLALFLAFDRYEIRVMSAILAERLYREGDFILCYLNSYEFTPVQLHSITERLKLAEPTCYNSNKSQDIAHLVEFITKLSHLKIKGSNVKHENSNIIPNNLTFDLIHFKYLKELEINNCRLEGTLVSADSLRTSLKSLTVHATLEELSSILLCGIVHWSPADPIHNWPCWNNLTVADFSHNSLTKIHSSVKLLSCVEHLNFSHNGIQRIENLETLSHLTTLNLSYNKIKNLETVHTKLGNIRALHLTGNGVSSLQGLSKLFSVTEVHLNQNFISSLEETAHLSKLPCLEVLNLQENPVNFTIDYRPQILLIFGSQASELILDGQRATEKELDTVAVLQALRAARGEEVSQFETQNSYREETISKNRRKADASNYGFDDQPGVVGLSHVDRGSDGMHDVTRFRQQIEALRRMGGREWLKMLNNMKASSSKDELNQESSSTESSNTNDVQLHTSINTSMELTDDLSPHRIKALAVSSELSYPDWFLELDARNSRLRENVMTALENEKIQLLSSVGTGLDLNDRYSSLISDTELLWLVILIQQETLILEVPVCVLLFYTKIVFLKLNNLSRDLSVSDKSCNLHFFPHLVHYRTIVPSTIASLTSGPLNAYIEIEYRVSIQSPQRLTLLMPNSQTAEVFIAQFQCLYDIPCTTKANPFVNNTLVFDDIHAGLPMKDVFVQNQIIFGQRVLVSRALHKCHHGILHHIFVTPSHVLLVEERLNFPHVIGLDITLQPQFHICALISVQTNIKHIHMEQVEDPSEHNPSSNGQELETHEVVVENKHLEDLYKCGSWLFAEFDSGVLLYVKFLGIKNRNKFFDAFLCARSQR